MTFCCLGIDPGLGNLGYGYVIRQGGRIECGRYGCIRSPSDMEVCLRILFIYEKLEEIVAANKPDAVSVERLFFGKNVTTAANVFQVRGAVLLLAARLGIPVFEPKPSEVKIAVCGNGVAEKRQVQQMVGRVLNMTKTPRPDDAADALAIAVTGISMANYANRIARGGFYC